jgi:UDPglucose 6-dehydrogenase
MSADGIGGAIRRVGIIGHGYVGRGTGHALARVVDVAWHDPAVAGSRPLEELARWAHALFVCVPTPMSESGAAELSIVHDVVDRLVVCGVSGPVVLRSTLPPGTTDALVRRGSGLGLVFCPEFLRERHYLEDAASPTRIVLGWSSAIEPHRRANVRELFTRRFGHAPLVEMSAIEAELLKYASNALFGVKVAFANEMADLAGRLGVDWEPIRAALVLDPRVGDGHLAVPGPDGQRGFGGRCLPKDMAALLAVASDLEVDLDVVAAAVRANRRWRRG